jgi:peptide/nickel transport system substrate-binding protein
VTLRAGIGSDVGSLDPHIAAGTGGGNWPNYTTHFATALRTDPNTSDTVPFAADWKWVDDNTALQVAAHPNVKFHNGEMLTAEVIKFNMDRLRGKPDYNPSFASGQASNLATVDHTEIVDPMTVKIVTKSPDVSLPNKLTLDNMPFVPMKYIIDGGDKVMLDNPVGFGPFKFVSRRADSEIRSTRFDDFFNPQGQKYGPFTPIVKDLVQRVIPEDAARAAALEAGEIDLAVNVSGDIGKSFEGRSGFKVIYLPGDQPMHIHMNTRLEKDPISGGPNPLRDVRVRRAMNMAVDVDTIIKTILTGKENYSYGFSSQTIGLPKAKLESLRFKYDPAKAKALLSEAGYANGFEVDFTGPIGRWPNSDQVIQAVAGYLKAVNIRTRISTAQYQPWVTEVQTGTKPGIWFMGLSAGADPSQNFRVGFHSKANYGSSIDPALGLVELIEKSDAAFDINERKAIIADIVTKQYENATWLYLYEPVSVIVATNKLDYSLYGKIVGVPQYWNMRLKA